MDLNYLYHRQQVSLFMSENAACEQSRLAHRGLLSGYAEKISRARSHRSRPRPELVA